MSHVCFFTGKKTQTGWIRAEKGARRDGGVGNKIKGRTKRKVKANLKKYLDKYHAEERPFPRPNRPMDLKNLKVVALVQDDETGEILQATQFDLAGAKTTTESIK